MTGTFHGLRLPYCCALVIAVLLAGARLAAAQTVPASNNSDSAVPPNVLAGQFFAAICNGDAPKILSYIPRRGVNLGPEAQPTTYDDVEQEFRAHRGLYCKLFDSSCIETAINLGNSARVCSYRELLIHSERVRTAASEVTRSGVRQAVLVARIKNDGCPNQKLIDFVFNLEADGWKLFLIP